MKYKLFIDLESDNYLREWAAENKRYVQGCPPLASDFELVFEKTTLRLYLKKRRFGFHFSFKNEALIAKGKIKSTPAGVNDYLISFELCDDVEQLPINKKEKIIVMMRGYIATFIHANAFLMYGNILNEKEYIAAGRNEGGIKVITFRKYKEKIYAVHTSSRKSPEGVYSVRGHFRYYKSGKVIWIDEYMKGTEKYDD